MKPYAWPGFFDRIPVFEPGDLVVCIGELEATRNADGRTATLEEIEKDLDIKLPRIGSYYFVREAYLSGMHTYVRLEEIVNPVLVGNATELSFHFSLFHKVDSVHNKININEL